MPRAINKKPSGKNKNLVKAFSKKYNKKRFSLVSWQIIDLFINKDDQKQIYAFVINKLV